MKCFVIIIFKLSESVRNLRLKDFIFYWMNVVFVWNVFAFRLFCSEILVVTTIFVLSESVNLHLKDFDILLDECCCIYVRNVCAFPLFSVLEFITFYFQLFFYVQLFCICK